MGQSEPQMSMRLVQPFIRAAGPLPGEPLSAWGFNAADPDARIGHSDAMHLLQAAVNMTGDTALGLHAAEMMEEGNLDLIEYVLRSSNTVAQGMESTNRYMRLMHDALEFSVDVSGDTVTLYLGVSASLEWTVASADYLAALVAITLRRATQGRMWPVEARFKHAAPGHLEEYTRVLRCLVTFDADRNALVFERDQLEQRLSTADIGLNAMLEGHAERLLKELPPIRNFTEGVRAILESGLETGNTRMAVVAKHMHVSGRTMRRRLHEEGTSYLQLLDSVQRKLAMAHLQADALSIGEIAQRLGFSRIPSFYRAFKRWTGVTPGEYRNRSEQRRSA